MNRSGHQVFPGPSFSEYENGFYLHLDDLGDPLVNLLHGGTRPNDVTEAVQLPLLGVNESDFPFQSRTLQGILDRD